MCKCAKSALDEMNILNVLFQFATILFTFVTAKILYDLLFKYYSWTFFCKCDGVAEMAICIDDFLMIDERKRLLWP